MSENGSYLDWYCGDCGHEVISPEQPAPIRWTDCHICTFIRKQGACQPVSENGEAMPTFPLTDITVKLIDEDGNGFMILGVVRRALQRAGYHDLASQYIEEATQGDYDHLLQTTMKYVNIE